MRNELHRRWRLYDEAVQRSFPATQSSTAFAKDKIAQGVLKLDVDPLEVFKFAQRTRFASSQTVPEYWTQKFSADMERDMNLSSHYRIIAGPLEQLLTDCIVQLKEPVANALGTPWRIHNVRAWTTPPEAVQKGMYSFHRDGFPIAFFKVMIYFTPMDGDHGGLEISDGKKSIKLVGPPGSWVLFYNSTIEHRGCAGASAERASAEITLSRAREFDLTLFRPGLNAHWPRLP